MTLSNIHEIDVLRWENLTDTVRKFPTTGEHWFRNNLFTTKKPLRGTDIATWDELTRGRKRAPYTVRGQPAQRMDLMSRGMRSCSVADIFVSKQLRADQIEYLRQYGTQDQEGSQAVINDELEEMVTFINNTVEHACMSVARGSLAIDQTASTTAVKSKGVKFTLTFPVATQAMGVWSNNGTRIYTTEMSLLFDKAFSIGLGMPSRIVHNSKAMDYLLQNTEVKDFLGEQYKTQLLRDGRISNIRGVNFQSYDTGDEQGGSWAKYWTDTELLVLPSDNRYFELFVGYRFLPVNRFAERIIKATFS